MSRSSGIPFVWQVVVSVCCAASFSTSALAQSSGAVPPGSPATVRWSAANMSRVESWSFFDPPPAGGDPEYTFVANRLRLGVSRAWPRVTVNASMQYVQFGGLPSGASGPGLLGTGAVYYDHSGRTDSRGVYLNALSARFVLPREVTIQAGRLPYQSGAESSSGRPKVETVKRARVDGRLIGEFEWSLYQRSFDGVRGDVDRPAWHASGAWFRPTQGGFEEDAGTWMRGIDVAAATLAWRPSVIVPATEVSVFALRYDDDRPVTGRPDNRGIVASRADIGITTLGATVVGSRPWAQGDADWLVWFAGQTGSWYEERHRAWSLAAEGGFQWKAPWQPWLRAGVLHASGDGDPRDDRHGTFFPMLPTVRKYAFTTAYSPMNLRDAFVELILRPTGRMTIRGDVRRLHLANAADLWYSGSGATQQRGRFFGYAGRPSGGATDFGLVFEGAADVAVTPRWSINGFVGTIRGGPVVHAAFAGDWLRFAYLENILRF